MSDSLIVREITTLIKDHLDAIKKEAHEKVLKLNGVDRDKAWTEIESAVDAYGGDMLTDATHWLQSELMDYSSIRWNAAVRRHLSDDG